MISGKEQGTGVGNGGSEYLGPGSESVIVPGDDQCWSGNLAQGDLPRAHRTRMSGKRLTVCSDPISEGAERRCHGISDVDGARVWNSADRSGSAYHPGIYPPFAHHPCANPAP